MKTSPLKINLILHIYAIAMYIEHRHAPAVVAALEDFLNSGLIKHDSESKSGFKILPKGKAWVTMICDTPVPEEQVGWFDPRTKEAIK